MGLTPEQIVERRQWIGASDVATIMGLNPYQTERELFLEKKGRLEPEPGNSATSLGTRCEPMILDFAEEELGPLKRNVVVEGTCLDFPLKARCDALAERMPVEAKTMGLYNAFAPGLQDWGDEFSDEVPDVYSVQVTAQMMCTGADVGHIFAFLSGRGICAFTIGRSSIVVEGIKIACGKFWECMETDTEPTSEGFLSLNVAKRLKRTPDKIVTLTEDCYGLINRLDEWKATVKEAEKNVDGLKAEIIHELADSEAGLLPDGRLVTFLETTRNNKPKEASVSKFRVLRVKGKKAAK